LKVLVAAGAWILFLSQVPPGPGVTLGVRLGGVEALMGGDVMRIREIAALSESALMMRAKDWTIAERLEVAAELEANAAALRRSAEIMEISALVEHPQSKPMFYLQQRKQ
jgi:hypothetical protein